MANHSNLLSDNAKHECICHMYPFPVSCTTYDSVTESLNIHKGICQGDVLSPLLFNIFINDIIPHFNEHECHPPVLDEHKLGCLLYADDLAIISTTKEGLQHSLNNLDAYCNKWKLTVNQSKSKVVCFTKANKADIPSFRFGNVQLEVVQNYCYLGIELNSNIKLYI